MNKKMEYSFLYDSCLFFFDGQERQKGKLPSRANNGSCPKNTNNG